MNTKLRYFLALGSLILYPCCQQTTSEPVPGKETEGHVTMIDLSHDYSSETIYWVTAQEFHLDTVFSGITERGYYYSANNFSTAEHGGTHMDAPIHFAQGGLTADQVPLEKLVGPAIKVDVSAEIGSNKDYLISVQDFLDWEKREQMTIPDGSIVLLETGHSKYYGDKEMYLGTVERGNDAVALLHFPGLSEEAAVWLSTQRKISSIGIDTPSIDYGQSKDFRSHVVLLSRNIPAFENLCCLDQLPASGFEVIALPMKIKGGSGAPLRIVARMRSNTIEN